FCEANGRLRRVDPSGGSRRHRARRPTAAMPHGGAAPGAVSLTRRTGNAPCLRRDSMWYPKTQVRFVASMALAAATSCAPKGNDDSLSAAQQGATTPLCAVVGWAEANGRTTLDPLNDPSLLAMRVRDFAPGGEQAANEWLADQAGPSGWLKGTSLSRSSCCSV